MDNVVLSVSSKWQCEELIREVLRKLHTAAPNATIRMVAKPTGTAKAARDFADALGFTIKDYTLDSWTKFAPEIRNVTMLSGIRRIPHDPEHATEVLPPAEMVIAFWCGTADNTKSLIDKALGATYPIVVYRENWTRRKNKDAQFKGIERATPLKRLRSKLGEWRKIECPS